MANHLILGKSAGYSIGGVKMRISEDARRSVVFFGIEGPEGIEYGGTGFLIQWIEGDLRWPYLVTARHVAEGLSKHETFFIRANLLNGDAISVEIEHASWVFPEDESVDLAVVPYGLNVEAMDHVHIPMPEFLANFDDPLAIACGDAINIVGLFRLHRGNKRAIPFVHCGWVSVLPDSNERVPIRNPATGKLFGSEAFLVEAQTLDGLSGSPVFIHEEIALKIPGGTINRHEAYPVLRGTVKLLGIFIGSWDGDPGEILAKDRGLRGAVRVPIGMGVVVSANKMADLLKNDSRLKEDRRVRGEKHRAQHAAVADSAIPAPPANGENPTHQEDFRRLLGTAARKPESKD